MSGKARTIGRLAEADVTPSSLGTRVAYSYETRTITGKQFGRVV
jgi:hypothetical protein